MIHNLSATTSYTAWVLTMNDKQVNIFLAQWGLNTMRTQHNDFILFINACFLSQCFHDPLNSTYLSKLNILDEEKDAITCRNWLERKTIIP